MMLSENETEGRYHIDSLEMKADNWCHLVMLSTQTGKRVINK